MAGASYAAYLLHRYIVVGLQVGIGGQELPVVVKFVMVAVVGTVLAFGAGHLSRHVPGVRVVLDTTLERRDRTARPA